MDVPEASVHTFVVRIWLEEKASESQAAIWRGHVTHVLSGTRRHFKQLSELHAFLSMYLEEMGVRTNPKKCEGDE